jgi:Macrocin-O-methyltransferase (TylF)
LNRSSNFRRSLDPHVGRPDASILPFRPAPHSPLVWLLISDKVGDNRHVELIAQQLIERLNWRVEVRRLRFKAAYRTNKPKFLADHRFALVHIDVDLYEPTRAALEFFHPRLSPGAVMICDDYGFASCPGARKAVDEYLADKADVAIELPSGQALIFHA